MLGGFRKTWLFASLGLASGIASALVGVERTLDGWQPLATLFGLHASLLPIGGLFALAMAVAVWSALRRPSAVMVVALATLYGWSGAVHIAIRLQRNVGDDAHLLAAGIAAGAFGAAAVWSAFALFAPGLRHLRALGLVSGTGALTGLLFYAGERGVLDKAALFIVWQSAVAAVLGLLLDRRPRS